MRLLIALGFAAATHLAHALDLGAIQVVSQSGEPFRAQVEVTGLATIKSKICYRDWRVSPISSASAFRVRICWPR